MGAMLEKKVVVVTGGASGIGRGIALAAGRHGARLVIVGDLQEDPREGGTTVIDELLSKGTEARFVRTDVADRASLHRLLAAAEDFGGVDIMACNAGITVASDGPDVTEDDYRKLMSVNTDGVLFSAQAAAAQMRALGKSGSIILTASIGGIRGFGGAVAYSSSKGAVRLMAASLADALGPEGIRVNAVCPGFVETHMMASGPVKDLEMPAFLTKNPLRRMGLSSEIGEAVCWLGSDLASFVTGVSLPVDGGISAIIY